MDNRERAKRFLRARTDLNQNGEETKTRVYELTGVPASALVAYEDPESTRALNVDYVQRLADHYGLNAAWLLGQSDSWSKAADIRQACEVTGLSPEAIQALQDLMQDDGTKRFINAFLASEEFAGMVYSLRRMQDASVQDRSDSPVDYHQAFQQFDGEPELPISEGDLRDMRIWRASRNLERFMWKLFSK